MTYFHSGLNGQSTVQLTLETMRRFSRHFGDLWRNWIQDSPWADDTFLSQRSPVGVAVRYGQNIPVCVSQIPGHILQEEQQWEEQRIWNRMKFMSFALATHIRFFIHSQRLVSFADNIQLQESSGASGDPIC